MTFLLDTNVCIRYLNGYSPQLRRKINTLGDLSLAVCSVVKAELYFGSMKSHSPGPSLAAQQEFLSRFRSFAFDDSAAEHYARIRATLSRRGQPIGANDILIAAIAQANNCTLVSHNVAEFSRVDNLNLEDWETD